MESQSLTTFLQPGNSADSGYSSEFGSECFNPKNQLDSPVWPEKIENLTIDERAIKEEEEEPIAESRPQVSTEKEEEKFVRYIIQAFTPDADGDTYLHILPTRGDVGLEQMQLMIKCCPSSSLLDIQNKFNQTAMHVAAILDLSDEIKMLIEKKASLELVDIYGKNMLHLCAERGHIKSLKAIIESCGKLDQMNLLMKLLEETNNNGFTPFFTAVLNKKKEVCELLVETFEGLDVNAVDTKTGNSPLHEAVMMTEDNADMVFFLLRYCNLDVNFQNNLDVTPLHMAAGKGDEAVCAILLQFKASCDIKDRAGNIPAVYAANDRILKYLDHVQV